MSNNKGGGPIISSKLQTRLKSKYTEKQFDTLTRFLKEQPEVCIFSGGK